MTVRGSGQHLKICTDFVGNLIHLSTSFDCCFQDKLPFCLSFYSNFLTDEDAGSNFGSTLDAMIVTFLTTHRIKVKSAAYFFVAKAKFHIYCGLITI